MRDDEQVSFTVRMPRRVHEEVDRLRLAERRSTNWTINELLVEALRARGVDVARQGEGAT